MKGWTTSFLLIAWSGVLLAQTVVPPKTAITVRTNERIDAKSPSESKIYSAVVDSDVVDRKGRVMIPRGSQAKLILCDATDNTVVVDLESLEVNGRRYRAVSKSEAVATPSAPKKALPPQTQVTFRLEQPLSIVQN